MNNCKYHPDRHGAFVSANGETVCTECYYGPGQDREGDSPSATISVRARAAATALLDQLQEDFEMMRVNEVVDKCARAIQNFSDSEKCDVKDGWREMERVSAIEIEKLKAALRFYADKENWLADHPNRSVIEADKGDTALDALQALNADLRQDAGSAASNVK